MNSKLTLLVSAQPQLIAMVPVERYPKHDRTNRLGQGPGKPTTIYIGESILLAPTSSLTNEVIVSSTALSTDACL